jgi:capsular exopolysaccharide synthesis family protein
LIGTPQELSLRPALPRPEPPVFLAESGSAARVPMAHYLSVLRRRRAPILLFVALVAAATWVVSARIPKIYEATAVLDVDRQSPSGIVGQDAARSAANDGEQFLATQVRLVQSDAVLRPVARRYGLREAEKGVPALAEAAERAPVVLKRLRVTRPPNTYLLQVSYRSTDPRLAAEVANAVAASYLSHVAEIRLRSALSLGAFLERQIEELKAKMERSGAALLALEKDLGVVNPEEKTNTLAARLLQLNTEHTAAQAERVKFEAAWQAVRSGTVESAQVAPQGETLRRLAEKRSEAREALAAAAAQYGGRHPEYQKAAARLAEVDRSMDLARANIARRVEIEFQQAERRERMLAAAAAAAKQEFDANNARSLEYLSRKREADADRRLYEELIRKIKESGINAGFQNSAIRVADEARPAAKPVAPNIVLNVLLAVVFGLVAATGAVLGQDALDQTLRDPEQAARSLNATVIGTLPLMRGRGREALAAPDAAAAPAGLAPLSEFGEAVRTLRNAVLLSSLDRHCRTLLVTSAGPGEGKTTTIAHLAIAHATQGRRTLLIDGDLRRPSVHRRLQLPAPVGLSNVLLGELTWKEALAACPGVAGLDVLPAGPPSRRAADVFGTLLAEILEAAAAEYDLVLLDAPPLIGFAEPLQMAAAVDGVLIVACAGKTERAAVARVIETLGRVRAPIVGLVLNQVHRGLSDSYSYYGKYQAYYRPAPSEAES